MARGSAGTDRKSKFVVTVATALLLSAPTIADQPERKPDPARQPADPPGKTPEDPGRAGDAELVQMVRVMGEPANVDELLEALETADKGIQTFQSGIMYDRQFLLQGDRHVRYGDLVFRVEPGATSGRVRRTFAIHFTSLYIDDEVRDDKSTWAFDGEWIIEMRPRDKSFVKRRISTPEDPVDPLGLGESPVPFPIGQRKAAIQQRYTATMPKPADGLELAPDDAKDDPEAAAESGKLIEFVQGTYQLRLVPRPDYADDEEFREIRLWYAKETFVPRMARVINRQGDVSVVKMISIKINQPLPKGAISTEPPTEPGWDIQIDEGRSVKPRE
jgi:outer membrane lipoprotein-sorting protein